MRLSQGLKQTIYYGIGTLVMKAVSLLMIPFITHYLSPKEFGTLEVLLTFINLVSIVICLGLGDALFKFCTEKKQDITNEQICANANVLAVITSLLLFIPAMLFSKTIATLLPGPVTNTQVQLVLIALLLGNILTVQFSWLRLRNKAAIFVSLNVLRAVFQASFVIITLMLGLSITGIMLATALSTFFIFIIASYYHYRLTGFSFNSIWQKKLLVYGSPLIISGLASFTTLGLDNWWLAYAIGPEKMAPYALAMKFAMVTIILMQPFAMWWYPNRFKCSENVEGRLKNASITQLGVSAGFLLGVIVAFFASIFIKYVIPSSYHQAINFMPWLCLIWSIKNAGDLMSFGCYLENTKTIMYINILIAIYTLIGFYIIIPHYAAWGSIYVLLSGFCLRWLLFLLVSQKLFTLPFRYKPLLMICAASIFPMITNCYYSQWNLQLVSLLISLILIAMVLFTYSYNDLKQFVFGETR